MLTSPLSRREWLQRSACGFGSVAMTSLLAEESMADSASGDSGLVPRQSLFPARAKRVVFLFMHGGVSHVDSFDPKPKLTEKNGQPLPFAKPKFEFAPTGNLLASPWKFQHYGQSGIEVSDLFPLIGSRIDDICVIRSLNGGDQVSHGPALLNINTGSGVFARPSLGAWTLYGLGTENQNLPGFVSLSPSLYHGGAQNYGSAFLPASYQGTRIGDGSTNFKEARLSNLSPGDDPTLQRLQLDLLAKRNRSQLERVGESPQRLHSTESMRNRPTNTPGNASSPGGCLKRACGSCRSISAIRGITGTRTAICGTITRQTPERWINRLLRS
jgi:hypothetical protein